MTEKRSETISIIVEPPPQNVRMKRVSYANAATLAAQDLVEEFKNTTPNESFKTINYTQHAACISLV